MALHTSCGPPYQLLDFGHVVFLCQSGMADLISEVGLDFMSREILDSNSRRVFVARLILRYVMGSGRVFRRKSDQAQSKLRYSADTSFPLAFYFTLTLHLVFPLYPFLFLS